MTAIDVSEFIVVDSPEVAALKEKVRSVARVYARQHNWCSVVETALREMGIDDGPQRNVIIGVETVFGATLRVRIDPTVLHEKNEEQQRVAVAEQIDSFTISGPGVDAAALKARPEMIREMTLISTPASAQDPHWWYLSDNGRVLHYFRDVGRVQDQGYGYMDGICGRAGARIQDLTQNSPVGENRRCERCEQRAGLR